MGFKGIFDGSVEIGQAREARDTQVMMQQRQIQAQMLMQQQQLRAQMAEHQSALAASTAQSNADRAQKQQQVQSGALIDQQKIDLGQQAQTLEQQKFDAGKSLQELQQANAKLMLQQAQQDFEEDQARRASQTAFRQSAFGAALITAALNGVAPVASLSRINQANGVADGDLGSLIGMGGGTEGLWYDVVAADEQGKLGKKRQEVDPMTLLLVAHSLYGEKGTANFIQMYKTKDSNNTRMNIAFDKYLQSLDLQKLKNEGAMNVAGVKSDTSLAVEDKKTDRAVQIQTLKQQVGGVLGLQPAKVDLATSVTKLGAILDDYDNSFKSAKKKGLPPDPEKVALREKTKALLDKVLAIGEPTAATPSASRSPTEDVYHPVVDGEAVGGRSAGNSATVSGTSVTVTIDGQTRTVEDSPALRDWLASKGISIK